MLDVRQLWRALHGVPQLLLVQPEQLNYDLAYALALLPLVLAGIIFFLQDALLLFSISFLSGIVCLLALQLARLTFGLPAWVGFKATHPLVASVLIACFFATVFSLPRSREPSGFFVGGLASGGNSPKLMFIG